MAVALTRNRCLFEREKSDRRAEEQDEENAHIIN